VSAALPRRATLQIAASLAPTRPLDFIPDHRLFILVAMALVVGTAGAAAAWALVHLSGQTLDDVLADREYVIGYDDELVGQLADCMARADGGRVPILRRSDLAVVGLITQRDLLRVRAATVRHEREREALIRLGKLQASTAA
jgi:CBS domain-containing protein